MYNSVKFVKEFICDEEGAKGYSDLVAELDHWRKPVEERKSIKKNIYDELISDINELRMKGIM